SCSHHQSPLPTYLVAKPAAQGRPNNASQSSTGGGKAQSRFAEVKLILQEAVRSANQRKVVAKEKATESGNGRNEKDILIAVLDHRDPGSNNCAHDNGAIFSM